MPFLNFLYKTKFLDHKKWVKSDPNSDTSLKLLYPIINILCALQYKSNNSDLPILKRQNTKKSKKLVKHEKISYFNSGSINLPSII